jgi:putative DNA primase/helicase
MTTSKPVDRWSDAAQAELIAKELDRVMWVPEVGWFQWDDTRWAPIDETGVTESIMAYYRRRLVATGNDYVAAIQADDKSRIEMLDTTMKLLKRRRAAAAIKGVLFLLQALTALKPIGDMAPVQRLDRNPPGRSLLNTPDGVVDLATGEVQPHDPDLLLTKITRGRYRPGYEHDDWTQAQISLPEDTLIWLQLRMGYAITGQPGKDAVFLAGHGNNGKSLFTNDGILRALGSYGMLVSNKIIAKNQGDAGAPTPDKAALRGCRFVLIEELEDETGFTLSTSGLKQIIGTGSVTARKLHKDSITFDTTHSLFINTNHAPSITETDWGTWRRLTLVKFPITFATNPSGPNEYVAVPGLDRRLRDGADGQYDAMVTWLVDGARKILADQDPVINIENRRADDGRAETVKASTWEWRESSDRLMAYVADAGIVFDPTGMVAAADLLTSFNAWLAQNGNSKWSMTLLHGRLRSHSMFRDVAKTKRSRDTNALSRPEMSVLDLPKLGAQFTAYPGIRFEREAARLTLTTQPTLTEGAS